MYLNNLFGLKNKLAIVTGGGRGIGQVVAVALAKAGAEIVILSRSGADNTVKMIEQEGGKATSLLCDVTNEASVAKVMDDIVKKFGRIDVVFNNAGQCYHKSAFEATYAEWRNIIEVNLTGEYIVACEAAKKMIALGIKGSIINMASMSGSIVNIPQDQASYNTSKAAVVHMTRSLAIEWAKEGIRVNSLSPGYIATPMATEMEPELVDIWLDYIPTHRMGKPEELCGAVIWLASDASSYTTGSDIIIDGGYTCI